MLIDGTVIAGGIQKKIQDTIAKLKGRKPCLAVILVGSNPASSIYVNRKISACGALGITSVKRELPESISEENLLKEIEQLNQNDEVDGILVQLPLPSQIHPTKVTLAINPEKDVDGFHPLNVGKLLIGDPSGFIPCTPLGIRFLIESTGVSIPGKHVVVVGRSNIVGKPVAALLMQNSPGLNATVTVANSHTVDLDKICQSADILIAAIGKPQFIKANMIKEGAIVIDVGTNKVEDPSQKSGYQLVGDVDFENVKKKCSHITPVPKGVGPMTIAMLMSNTLLSYQRRNNKSSQ